MKTFWFKFVKKYKENKMKTLLEVICLGLFSFLMFGIQVLSTRHLLNLIPNIVTIILFVLVCLYGYFYGKLCLEMISMGFILFLIYTAIVTLFTTKDFSETFGTMIKLFLLFVTIINFYFNFPYKQYFLLSFIVSVFILACNFIYVYRAYLFSFAAIENNRLGADFGSSNIVSSAFSMGVLSICIHISSFKNKILNGLLGVSIIILIFLIFKTESRLPLIVSVLSLAFLFVQKLWVKHKALLFVVIGLIVASVLFLSFIPSLKPYFDRFGAIFNIFNNSGSSDGSTNIRFMMQINGYQLWLKNLFFGYGANGFLHNTSYIYYSHSTLCELLVNFGLIGTLFFLFGLFYICFKQYNKRTFGSNCAMFFVVCYLLPSLFAGMVMYDKKYYIFVALIAAEYLISKGPNIGIFIAKNTGITVFYCQYLKERLFKKGVKNENV